MMAARIETLQSEVESLRKDVDERDIVAILLDNAIKMGLLRTDHIQYLSLKWGLLQAFGITHSEAKMTGEFAKLKDFKDESLKFHLPWQCLFEVFVALSSVPAASAVYRLVSSASSLCRGGSAAAVLTYFRRLKTQFYIGISRFLLGKRPVFS